MYTGLTDSVWKGAGRKNLSLTLNGTAVTGELLSLTLTAAVNGDQALLTIGNTCARTVQMQFSGIQTDFLDGALTIAAQAGGETLPIGVFRVTEATTRGGQTTVTAVDAMGTALEDIYTPAVTGTMTAWAVLSDLAGQYNLTLSTRVSGFRSVLLSCSMATLTAGNRARSVVGWIAGLCGRNAVIDRSGKLDFLWYTGGGATLHQQDCYEGMDQLQSENSVFSMLSVSVVDANGVVQTLTPSAATGSGGLVENNFMTQSRLNAIWGEIGGLTYRPGDLSFLGDLRLDAGDLLTLTLDSGSTCTVPVMSLTQTYDGGVTTHVTAQGQGESATAGAVGGGALTSKVRYLTAEVAQFAALTVTDDSGTTKINGGRIDTDSLFAQDITATGTISGAELIGAQLRGEAINISATSQDAASLSIVTEFDEEFDQYALMIRGGSGHNFGKLVIGSFGAKLTGTMVEIGSDNLVDSNYSSETYTSFSGGVVSSGTVRVLKKFGWCLVHGSVVLSSAASNWATVLSSSAVPAPQHGDGLRQVCPYWGTSYTRPAIVSIGSSGGLLLRYGAAGSTAYFHFCYPID